MKVDMKRRDFLKGTAWMGAAALAAGCRLNRFGFGEGGPVRLTITGHTPLMSNPVQVRFEDGAGETTVAECPFAGGDAPGAQTFGLTVPKGLCDVTFVFLPGCRFDFEGFQFTGGMA